MGMYAGEKWLLRRGGFMGDRNVAPPWFACMPRIAAKLLAGRGISH